MINTFIYTKPQVLGELFLENTNNIFEYICHRPYHDKRGQLPDGVVVTLHILEDHGNYGVDKASGKPRLTNRGQNFNATILGVTELDFEQGDHVRLLDFDEENSFAINFDIIMRFRGIEPAVEL